MPGLRYDWGANSYPAQSLANRLFGSATPELNFDPKLLTGWGNRKYDWEFSAGGVILRAIDLFEGC